MTAWIRGIRLIRGSPLSGLPIEFSSTSDSDLLCGVLVDSWSSIALAIRGR